jgi:hypothetical protein
MPKTEGGALPPDGEEGRLDVFSSPVGKGAREAVVKTLEK